MSKIPERLWTDAELDNYDATITNLRKMRSAAVYGLDPAQRVLRTLTLPMWRLPIPEDRQGILRDGEHLAAIAGGYLAERVVENHRNPAVLEEWKSSLVRTTDKYGGYSQTTFASTSNTDVAKSFLTRLRATHVDPRHMLKWGLFRENNIGATSIDDLLSRNIVLVAPFSGDLLAAALFRAHIQLLRGRSFTLKAAAFSKDLKHNVLPNLEGAPEAGILLDVVQTGNSGRALAEALRRVYPQLLVHNPPEGHIPFEPSKKISRAMSLANRNIFFPGREPT